MKRIQKQINLLSKKISSLERQIENWKIIKKMMILYFQIQLNLKSYLKVMIFFKSMKIENKINNLLDEWNYQIELEKLKK